jgi:hypothetical protein
VLLSSPFKREHFGFKLGAFLAEALTCFDIYEAHLNKVDFGPTRALGIEMPLRLASFCVCDKPRTYKNSILLKDSGQEGI